jgi:hypothetical protein
MITNFDKTLRERVAQSLAATTVFPNEVARWQREADAAILAILEELSRINLCAGLCSPTLVEADQERFRAISRALLDLFKKEIAR